MKGEPYRLSDFFPVERVHRDGAFLLTDFCDATLPGTICFVANKRFARKTNRSELVSCVIAPPDLRDAFRDDAGVVISDNPTRDFYILHNRLVDAGMAPDMPFGRAASAQVHPTAIVAPETYVGERVEIGPGAVIAPYTYLDDDVKVGPYAVLGADAHFFKRFAEETLAVKHAGGVKLHRRVEVLAAAIISRALHANFTEVGEESVISIQAHLAHGVRIGRRTSVTGKAQVSGYTVVGDDVWIGPGAMITNLITIGDRARIELGAVVVAPVEADEHVSGNFAYAHDHHMRAFMRHKMDEA